MKRAGYDMDAGAKRLQNLLDKQKKEREEREMNSTKSEEASPMIKPPKNEFAKKEDAFAHARQHGGKVMKKTFIHPTSGMKNVSYVVKEETELDEAIKKPNATTRFLRQYPVSDKEMAKPVKKPEKKKPEQGVAEVTEAGPFSYGAKPPRKGSVAYNALMKRKEQDRNRVKEIEAIGTKNHHVGVAKVTREKIEDVNELEEGSKSETEGMVSYIHHIIKNHVYPRAGDKEAYMQHVAKEMPSIVKSNPKLFRRAHSIAYDRFFHVDKNNNNNDYDHTDHSMRQGEMGHRKGMSEAKDTEIYKYIDQSGGQVIKGKSGTYVGYTHSATKGKGANILKHNDTKKYYAAGGSSTAFTQKTTLHDTPQAAAKAYHKGNLVEELNYGKSFKDLREAAFNSNCCPDEEYGFTEEQFTVTGTEQYEDWGDDIVEGKLSFSKLSQKLHEEDGKNVKLNKPFLTPGGPKKRAVYVKNDKGNTVKVNFGDPNLEIKRDDPERKSSFRARHNCDNPGPKWKARYWSCKFWSSTPVSKL